MQFITKKPSCTGLSVWSWQISINSVPIMSKCVQFCLCELKIYLELNRVLSKMHQSVWSRRYGRYCVWIFARLFSCRVSACQSSQSSLGALATIPSCLGLCMPIFKKKSSWKLLGKSSKLFIVVTLLQYKVWNFLPEISAKIFS